MSHERPFDIPWDPPSAGAWRGAPSSVGNVGFRITEPDDARLRLLRQHASEALVEIVEDAISRAITESTATDDLVVRATVRSATGEQRRALIALYESAGWDAQAKDHVHGTFEAGATGVDVSDVWFDLVLRMR